MSLSFGYNNKYVNKYINATQSCCKDELNNYRLTSTLFRVYIMRPRGEQNYPLTEKNRLTDRTKPN